MIPAATIATDAQITLQHLLDTGRIAAGDTVAVIYQETDFGEQANEGVQEFAAAQGLTVSSFQVKPTDTDLTAAVGGAVDDGATAIVAGVARARPPRSPPSCRAREPRSRSRACTPASCPPC